MYEPFNTAYNHALEEWMLWYSGIRPTLYDLSGIIKRAFDATFLRRNIINGFQATGIVTLNENTSDEDFALAKIFIPSVY